MNFVIVCDKSYIESATALSDKECSSLLSPAESCISCVAGQL